MSEKRPYNWRTDGPQASHYEMVGPDGGGCEPTMFVAGEMNKDKATLANALECDYTEVRTETVYCVWDPEDAERRWREDRCDCEEPHYGDDLSKCSSTKAASDLFDFWDEGGWYCPWRRVKKGTPGALKFRIGRIQDRSKVSV